MCAPTNLRLREQQIKKGRMRGIPIGVHPYRGDNLYRPYMFKNLFAWNAVGT